jgi:hypothetical protein
VAYVDSSRAIVATLAASLLLGFAAAAGTGPVTFCNPLNLDYGWGGKGHRHSADPVVVLFQNRYWLFATDDVPGYRVSDDLLAWSNVLFAAESRALMSDNAQGFYCAPAVATDGANLYFIRMDRRKGAATVPVMRTADPASGRWEKCGELRRTGDPALFFDDDGRAWLYHGLGANQPTKVFEIDRKTWTEIPGSERQLRPAVTNLVDLYGGYERGRRELLGEEDAAAWLGRFAQLPCQEAAWMTKRGGRYYLQYATPGTVTEWYCDTVMEGASPTGPFRHVPYAPASLKVGGFMGSAGHSCVFQDRHGNWWRMTTMWVGVHDLFERRLGLFPVGFDADGRMFTQTAFGDYPQVMPEGLRQAGEANLADWHVLSYGKLATASSALSNHPPALATDEECRTWWSAESAGTNEWFQLDLGAACRVQAVQINFAEQDAETAKARAGDDALIYRLAWSEDGESWRPPGGGVRAAKGPHDYLALPEPALARHLRVSCVRTPAGGRFALRDLRAFGFGAAAPPSATEGLVARRHADDDRNATLTWRPSAAADGYLVRFGDAPDRLYHSIQLQGGAVTSLVTHALNRGVRAAWRVDAFGAGGVAEGRPAWEGQPTATSCP